MRQIFRIIGHLLVFMLVLLVIAAIIGGVLVWKTMPGGSMSAAIPGLSAPVAIDLDADGIPRIHAANEQDAAAALGYLHARDRMFQMDLTRRAAAGELAELLGPRALPTDRMMRTLGVRASAEADLPNLPAPTRAVLEAYARGVNSWIAERGHFAGLEYLAFGAPRPWTALDSLLWGKSMGLYLSDNWRTELARAALSRTLPAAEVQSLWPPDTGAGHPEASIAPAADLPGMAETAIKLARVLPIFPAPFTLPQTASDEWAVDGRHSDTGAPLLAGDPHLGFAMPGTWYLARIDTPAGVLAGATAPGIPFLVLGHNSNIAWSFTTTGADVQDLFEETPSGADAYMTPDGPRPFTIREERIHVRGKPDEVLKVRETRHGPVISDLVAPQGPILAASMGNLAPGDTAAAGLQALNHASTVDEAGRAAAQITSPVQNMLVADRQHIGLFVTGRVPIRRAGDGSSPVPGADGAHDWIGWASGDQLPHITNPASGRLVNANERVAPPDFPVFMGKDWFGDWRARRIRQLLDSTDHHGVANFTAMQVDMVSSFAQSVLPRLRAARPADEHSRVALALLAAWDGSMATDKPQPLIFNAWMRKFRKALLARLNVPDGPAVAETELLAAALAPDGGARCGGDCGPMLTDTLAAVLAELAPRFGADPASWRWGRAHRAAFDNPLFHNMPVLKMLGGTRISAPGDDTTLFRAGMQPGSFHANHGASYRGVYDLADLDASRFVVAPGQSGNVLSRLAWNFLPRWRDGATVTLGPVSDTVSAHIDLTPAAIAEGSKS
jgi:penicillin G amidase